MLPPGLAEPLARGLGAAAWAVAGRRRRVVRANLRRIRPDCSPLRREVGVVATFASYGRYWYELFRAPSEPRDVLAGRLEVEGLEHLHAALAGGRGCILALPHTGAFDVAGAWLAAQGWAPVAVAERLEPPELFEWFCELRRRLGIEVVPLGPEAAGALVAALRSGRVVGLLCDRDLGGDGQAVELFGETTTLPAGPALLALRTGAPLVPAAVYLAAHRRYRARVLPPLPVERRGRLRDDVARVTRSLAHTLEELIAAAPTQWHVMQPNWPSDRARSRRRHRRGT